LTITPWKGLALFALFLLSTPAISLQQKLHCLIDSSGYVISLVFLPFRVCSGEIRTTNRRNRTTQKLIQPRVWCPQKITYIFRRLSRQISSFIPFTIKKEKNGGSE
jgi:hypothetical protein